MLISCFRYPRYEKIATDCDNTTALIFSRKKERKLCPMFHFKTNFEVLIALFWVVNQCHLLALITTFKKQIFFAFLDG